MNTAARLGLYAVGLVAAFGVAAGVGAAAGPIDVGGDDSHNAHGAEPADPPVAAGTRLVPNLASTPGGAPFHYMFTVEGPDGPIVDFAELHERRLHLIVVSDDLVDFWHLHPEMTPDGAWHIEMPALEPRVYTVYADFQPVGHAQTTLQQRIIVTDDGRATAPRELPAPSATTTVDGFEVTLSGNPVAGDSTLQFDVTRDGQTITTEPYLGALGHLVAIRAADHGYLHVHPLDGDGPEVRFATHLPAAGTYRLFLDFSVDGQVRTAAFTLDVPGGDDSPPSSGSVPATDTAADHDTGHDTDHGEHGS